jgi:hypothetical protein
MDGKRPVIVGESGDNCAETERDSGGKSLRKAALVVVEGD